MIVLKKGDKVFRYYSCEPAIIYGSGKVKEAGEVIGDPIDWKGIIWIPIKWQYSQGPSLDAVCNIFLEGEEEE